MLKIVGKDKPKADKPVEKETKPKPKAKESTPAPKMAPAMPMPMEPMMGAPAEDMTPMDMPAGSVGGTVEKEKVNYRDPIMVEAMRCADCMHFDGTSNCDLVAGPVEADGTCNLFDSGQEMEAEVGAEEEMPPPNAVA